MMNRNKVEIPKFKNERRLPNCTRRAACAAYFMCPAERQTLNTQIVLV